MIFKLLQGVVAEHQKTVLCSLQIFKGFLCFVMTTYTLLFDSHLSVGLILDFQQQRKEELTTAGKLEHFGLQ